MRRTWARSALLVLPPAEFGRATQFHALRMLPHPCGVALALDARCSA
jgi:hypothetical protein